jgi:hypothetical protein
MVARYHTAILEHGAASRALRRGVSYLLGQVTLGQATVALQRAEDYNIASLMHGFHTILLLGAIFVHQIRQSCKRLHEHCTDLLVSLLQGIREGSRGALSVRNGRAAARW